MNSKERFEFMTARLPEVYKRTAEEVITGLVNQLIAGLYIPVKGNIISQADRKRIAHFGIEDEPINWGDLKCIDVKKFDDGSFLVIIDEACPGQCHTFCNYIQEYMLSYGWQIKAETEW